MQIRIARADGYLRAELSGRQSAEDMREAIASLLNECRRQAVPSVLIVTRASRPLFKLEDFRLSSFLEEMTSACRVAMVAENRELRAADEYIASMARQRRLAVRTFNDEAAAVRWLRGDRVRKYQFTRIVLAGAPNESGVYALWKNDELIYYGRASGETTIRSCLLQHYQLKVDATHYSWEMCRDPSQREAELLREHEELFGQSPRLNAGSASRLS
jgi:hypothetical protein